MQIETISAFFIHIFRRAQKHADRVKEELLESNEEECAFGSDEEWRPVQRWASREVDWSSSKQEKPADAECCTPTKTRSPFCRSPQGSPQPISSHWFPRMVWQRFWPFLTQPCSLSGRGTSTGGPRPRPTVMTHTTSLCCCFVVQVDQGRFDSKYMIHAIRYSEKRRCSVQTWWEALRTDAQFSNCWLCYLFLRQLLPPHRLYNTVPQPHTMDLHGLFHLLFHKCPFSKFP